MSYKAIYTYAWDLAETGVKAAAREFRELGLDTVTFAGSYHAGKFLRPHGKTGKVFFPDDGTVYFKASPSRYGSIKPVQNGPLGERDVLRELVEDSGMAVNVWLVLLHNTRLGMAHPDSVVRNAFGDHVFLQSLPFCTRGARLRHRPREGRDGKLPGDRPVVGGARLYPLCAWLPP